MVFGVVVAGGTGARMGADMPKQFLAVGGKPIVLYSLERFLQAGSIDYVILMCHPDWVEYAVGLLSGRGQEMLNTFEGRGQEMPNTSEGRGLKDVLIAAGGETRNDTIMNAISFIDDNFGVDGETILVTHDAARPFVTDKMIEENIEVANAGDVCITAVPATDTIAGSRNGSTVDEIPDRAELYQVQTPQSFRAAEFRELYKLLDDEKKHELTDASKVFLMSGRAVKIVPGDAGNIKITHPGDLDIAESIAQK